MADTTALPLQQLIASLDATCLPKVLQVCSGVYFQGSIYELSGSEVCFSTGDLIKVIGMEIQSVCCEDISNKEKFDLPINHTGLFKVVPEELPYSTVEEMLKLRPLGLESCLPFTFKSRTKMTFGNFTLGSGKAVTMLSTEQPEGREVHVRCHVQGHQETSADVCIPLSTRGEFYECENEECFTLQEIMSSSSLRSRRFRFINKTKSEKPLLLTPVYQVHAIMSLRKNILKFPSSLEVDVIDVTNLCKDADFVTPFSLTEVLSRPDEAFPAVVEILESPENQSMFKCSWLPELRKNSHLVFHGKGTSALILISSLKSRKVQQHFLVSDQYGGKFRRRPREFNSVYEMYVASVNVPGLRVSVTRNCEEIEEEGLPALSVGEQLEVIRCERMEVPCGSNDKEKQTVEALLCHRIPETDEEDDDDDDEDDEKQAVQEGKEEIYLPLYMQGHFLEVLADSKKKYRLKELGNKFILPLDVKVTTRDAELENDPLAGFPCLRIEGAMLEPTIQASFTNSPDQCFEIPTQWLSMSVSFTKDPLPWSAGHPPKCRVDSITEVTDMFFYEFRKQGNSGGVPPPRPPKRNLSSSTAPAKSKPSKKSSSKAEKSKHRPDKSISTKDFSSLTLNSKRRPPAPPPPATSVDELPPIVPRKHAIADRKTRSTLPNTYVRREDTKKKGSFCDTTADVDSEHDYEDINDGLAEMVRKAQENVAFY